MTTRQAWHRARPTTTALAAAAVVSVTLPLHGLFSPGWFTSTTITVVVVAVLGLVARTLFRQPFLVAATQTVAAAWAMLNLHAHETTWWSLPTPQSARAVAAHVVAALHSINQSAAPVKLTAAITVSMVIVVAVLALAVDLIAVTLQAPAAAGLPLLAAYVASAANSGTGLSPWFFLVPALLWVGLIGHDGLRRLHQWGGAVARPMGGVAKDPARQLLGMARALALVGIAGAVGLPTVLPHLPPTFLADGLGRAEGARGGDGSSLTSTLDVSRNLQERSDAIVLTYTTTVPAPPPLRVDVLTRFENGEWIPTPSTLFDTGGALPTADQSRGAAVAADTPRVSGVTKVARKDLRRPQIALPGVVTALDLPAATWRVDTNALPRLLEPRTDYNVTWEELTPRSGAFGQASSEVGPVDALAIDPAGEAMIERVLADVAPPGLAPADTAWRIQGFLRSSAFAYSEALDAVREVDANGQPLSPDPVTQFLVSRRGYCVQFATTMALMARQRGIPARVAVGFLPGALKGSTWSVRAKDAHAWPELWFAETGWLRFEPTPGVRAGIPPTWSMAPAATPSASASGATPSASASERTERDIPEPSATATSQPALTRVGVWMRQYALLLSTLALAALALAALPVAAALGRRRALRRARDDAERVEILWQSMLSRLEDVGIRPDEGDTPRQAGSHVGTAALLTRPGREALTRVVRHVEQTRYAVSPQTDVAEVDRCTTLVVHQARSRRRLLDRVRAILFPSAGRRAWSSLLSTVGSGGARRRGNRRPW